MNMKLVLVNAIKTRNNVIDSGGSYEEADIAFHETYACGVDRYKDKYDTATLIKNTYTMAISTAAKPKIKDSLK